MSARAGGWVDAFLWQDAEGRVLYVPAFGRGRAGFRLGEADRRRVSRELRLLGALDLLVMTAVAAVAFERMDGPWSAWWLAPLLAAAPLHLAGERLVARGLARVAVASLPAKAAVGGPRLAALLAAFGAFAAIGMALVRSGETRIGALTLAVSGLGVAALLAPRLRSRRSHR